MHGKQVHAMAVSSKINRPVSIVGMHSVYVNSTTLLIITYFCMHSQLKCIIVLNFWYDECPQLSIFFLTEVIQYAVILHAVCTRQIHQWLS